MARLDKIKNVNALQENIGFIIINKKYKIPFIIKIYTHGYGVSFTLPNYENRKFFIYYFSTIKV